MAFQFIETEDRNDRAIATWLLAVAFLVFAMIIVGGATRLTESGLSMVHWNPISGVLPPMSEAEWAEEFAHYQEYPEYQKVNAGMSVDEFKSIFYWEYGHRLLGRFIGLAFALPLLFFLAKRMVRTELKMRLFALLALGGGQGLMGWYMVKSGLVDRPDVSHYRLAAHLMLALLIISALGWVALQLLRPTARHSDQSLLRRLAIAMTLLVSLQLFWGVLVAGLNAGFDYNTWPLMAGALVPSGLLEMSPWWTNFFESILTVQFIHRLGAYLVFALATGFLVTAYRQSAPWDIRCAAWLLLGVVMAQVAIGIWTLLAVVPVALGTLHQAVGVMVLSVSVWLLYELRAPPAETGAVI